MITTGDTGRASRSTDAATLGPMRRTLAVAGPAVLLGTVTLLLAAGVGATALLAVLPHLDPGLAGRTPLLLAGLALGGRLRIDGPAVGRLDPLREGGLLGRPDRISDGAGHLSLVAVPATLTLLAALVVALRVRRSAGPVGPIVLAVAAGFAAVGALLAALTRATVDGSTVRLPVLPTVLGGALVGALAAAAGCGLRYRLPGARFAVALTGLLSVGGLLAVVVLAVTGQTGAVGSLVAGDHAPTGPVLLLGVLTAPAVAWDACVLALGVPLQVSARALSIHTGGSVTVLDAVRDIPAFALLPALALGAVVGAAAVAARAGTPAGPLGPVSMVAAAVVVAGVGRLAGEVALSRHAGDAREAVTAATSGWISLGWGIVVGVLTAAVLRTGGVTGGVRP